LLATINRRGWRISGKSLGKLGQVDHEPFLGCAANFLRPVPTGIDRMRPLTRNIERN
jgi:hypothetical protein